MPSIHETLRAAGIWLMAGDEWPSLGAECAGLARRLREKRARTVGLVPADDDVAVPAVAIHLGGALAGRSARPVGVVDAQGSWAGASVAGEAAAEGGTGLVTSWLRDDLAVLAPRAGGAGAALQHVRGILAAEGNVFDHLVFDLTGFDHRGEQLTACELLEAVALVARSGRTTVRRIERGLRDLPAARCLGVLLTGM
ncbi:MAG TPA: hypothetical protein VIV57_19215 [Anaeromyxobacter sp.]